MSRLYLLHDGISYNNTLVGPTTHRLPGIVDREWVAWRREDYEAPQTMYME